VDDFIIITPEMWQANSWPGGSGRAGLLAVLLGLAAAILPASGRSVPDPGNPPAFFTTVADKLLRGTFPFGITNIPVSSNGVCVYTPAVQRLLQLSANLCDAANTNVLPSVFRPLFANDASGNLFITGYAPVTYVSGATDSQLSAPYTMARLAGATGSPIADASGPVNVYGVPWIIGVKKGLPNFNQFSLLNAVQVTRKLEVVRSSTDPATAAYATNQMYLIGISNIVGVQFWNSYSNAYPRPVTIYASDVVSETLTNSHNRWTLNTNFTATYTLNLWPGAAWSGTKPNQVASPASFVNLSWPILFQSPLAYNFNTAQFDVNPVWQTTSPPLPPLPQLGLLVTNYLQAFILDGSNVIDYVQLSEPVSIGSLNQTLADFNYPDSTGVYYQWSTNSYSSSTAIPFGVVNQLWVSEHPSSAPAGGLWTAAPTPMGVSTPDAEAAYFNGFYVPSFQYVGKIYVNVQLAMQAPYTPSRTVYSSFLLQANDPLVHYLASDLNSQVGAWAIWADSTKLQNGVWYHVDYPSTLPVSPSTPVGGRYQPWLRTGLMNVFASLTVVPVSNNYACRDSLIYSSDDWNFPTNLMSSLAGLGQVHRGTPWQTFYLKDANLLKSYVVVGGTKFYAGTNTWMLWTGNADPNDAVLTAPVNDWPLAGLLLSVLNPNDPTQLFSVNEASLADWENLMNGVVAYSNSLPIVVPTTPLQFDTYLMASNSPQAAVMATAILQNQAGRNGVPFASIGDLLAVSALTFQSPFLNLGSSAFGQQQTNYGITDLAYEAVPAQLLPRLRADSIGALALASGAGRLSFSGTDGYVYAVQTSTNLTDWTDLATNQPVQGIFNVPFNPSANSAATYFRTRLLPDE